MGLPYLLLQLLPGSCQGMEQLPALIQKLRIPCLQLRSVLGFNVSLVTQLLAQRIPLLR